MSKNALIEELRESLLWEVVSEYVERIEQVDRIVQSSYLRDEVEAERGEIYDSEDFCVTTVTENNGRIVVNFEMPFLMSVNGVCSLMAVAVGRLDIPDAKTFPYYEYDFDSMSHEKLLTFSNLVSITELRYEDIEILNTNA